MTYVIAEACIDVKDGACTLACPVDCIYEGGRMFYIQPDECINCGLCVSVCPVDAIYEDELVPEKWRPFIGANAEFFDAAVSGLGAPGGWSPAIASRSDAPLVQSYETRTRPAG